MNNKIYGKSIETFISNNKLSVAIILALYSRIYQYILHSFFNSSINIIIYLRKSYYDFIGVYCSFLLAYIISIKATHDIETF